MAVAVYTPLNAPLLTTTDLTAALRLTIPTSWNIPVYDDYPSDLDIVRFGVYVSDIHTVDRNPYKLGVTYGGDIYNAVDQFGVTYISFQDDPYNVQINAIIANLVTDEIDGIPLMDGYFQRDFSQELIYGTQAERHNWTFKLTRLEFNN